MTSLHIGKEIEKIVEKRGIKPAELGRRLNNMSPNNVRDIYKRPSVKIDLLEQIGKALDYDFIDLINNGGVSEPDPVYGLPKKKDIEKENERLIKENNRLLTLLVQAQARIIELNDKLLKMDL